MGVHGLWELLAPVGRRVSVETLAGRKLAIDASIWMIQFMKAMRDEKGEMVRNAHILGFFRRICKLLYLRTKPVFVFDGGTPALKRRTVIARRRQRENAQAKIRKTAEKLLLNHPEMHGKVDPAVLAALPPSMQLDLLVQMRERLMAENRQKYQKVKKAPARFSELQIESYLKTVAFRREIDGVQKSAAGRGIGGVQTSRIASEANREFIFSSSFTGDKEALASVGQERNEADQSRAPPVESSSNAVNKDQQTKNNLDFARTLSSVGQERNGSDQSQHPPVESSSIAVNKDQWTENIDAAAGSTVAESEKTFNDEVETYLDERGRLRVSRVRALGIRMTRDLQRNLDLMKEMDQEKTENNNESVTTRNLSGVLDDSYSRIQHLEATVMNNGTNNEVDKIREPVVVNGASIEISFEATLEPDKHVGDDDGLFARLVAGDPITDFSVHDSMISKQSSHTASDNEWEEGVIEGKSTEYQNEEGMNDEEEVEWEEGNVSQNLFPKGALEEESAFQEANRRIKEDTRGQRSMDDIHENLASEGKSTKYPNVEEMSDEGEVEWEEGFEDIQLKSSSCPGESNKTVTKGALEEEASLQEAIRRSLEDVSGSRSMVDFRENHTSERARGMAGMAGETTGHVFVREGKEGSDVATSSDDVHRPFGSMNDLDNLYSEAKTSAFIEFGSERVNLDPKPLNQDAGEKIALATDTLLGGEAKEHPSDTYSVDSGGLGMRKLVDACSKKVGHDRRSSAFTDSPPDRVLDSGSADAKNLFQAESDEHFNNTGKPSVDDSVIDVDELASDEIDGNFLMEKEANENYYQDHKIVEDRLEEEILFLGKEREELGSEQRRLERNAESVSNDMFAECQELLQMFGLPYIIAPMEAEAQCAFMELSNLVDGVVTDDSDAFLFGAQCVYKNIFDDRKYVETYLMKDIENELGLDREKLIHMALLLGSDYTEGISGVGIVNSIEVVNAFHGKEGLREFREWIESPDPSILGKLDVEAGGNSRKNGSEDTDDAERKKQIFKDKHRNVSKNWHVSSSFPSDTVIAAYASPQVDKSTESFAWGKPDLFVLRKLCWEKFGWGSSKADELLLPVLKEYNKHETQLRLEAFYTFNERFAKIRSKRIEKAVKGITGSKSSALMDETPPKSSGRGKKRKVKPHEDELNQLEIDSTGVDGAATSIKDNTTVKPTTDPPKKGQTKKKNSRRILEESIDIDEHGISRNEPRVGGRKRGRGRGQRSGRGRKKADTGTSYDDASSSENDEEMKSHTSEEAHQLRRSGRPRKNVKYNVSEEFDSSDKEGLTSLDEGIMPKESLTYQEIGGVDNSLHDQLNEGGDFRMGDRLLSEEVELAHGLYTTDRSLIDDGETKDPSDHGQESKDYLQFGGGFCMDEDEEDGSNGHASSPTRETMLENSDILTGADPRDSNLPDTGTPDIVINTNDHTSRSDHYSLENAEDDPENCNVISLRAMPNLRRKRRKN
ncbi:5'-3' exonuclease family protein [Perilla frutescens var. frutescens]|nr:5'-3' exonuclease family protein [Perilla frutescens var. frutescens]